MALLPGCHMLDCLLHPARAGEFGSYSSDCKLSKVLSNDPERRVGKLQGLYIVSRTTVLLLMYQVCLVAKACHLTTCRLLAPRNKRKRAKTRPGDAPISVRCLVIDILGCPSPSKSSRANPAKNTLLPISLARQAS